MISSLRVNVDQHIVRKRWYCKVHLSHFLHSGFCFLHRFLLHTATEKSTIRTGSLCLPLSMNHEDQVQSDCCLTRSWCAIPTVSHTWRYLLGMMEASELFHDPNKWLELGFANYLPFFCALIEEWWDRSLRVKKLNDILALGKLSLLQQHKRNKIMDLIPRIRPLPPWTAWEPRHIKANTLFFTHKEQPPHGQILGTEEGCKTEHRARTKKTHESCVSYFT